MPTFSAYLSVYNDWEILPQTLRSIKPLVSELIVVDGGYTWMRSYLEMTGKNPGRSMSILYDILDASGIPYRAINHVWANELEKRIAGYNACTTDYVFRVDADEVTYLWPDHFSSFIKNGEAVANMDLPMYDSPGYIQWPNELRPFPGQGFLFDRNQVSAEDHLRYLWLVLTSDSISSSSDLKAPYQKSVAFNAHLSQWRSPLGGTQRATFYTLNFMRKNGAPDRAGLPPGPLLDFTEFFQIIPPMIFESAMKRSHVINALYKLDRDTLSRSPLTNVQELTLTPIYDRFLKGVSSLTESAFTIDQGFIAGNELCFHRAPEALGQPWKLSFEFDCEIETVTSDAHFVATMTPYAVKVDVKVEVAGRRVNLSVPSISWAGKPVRQILTMTVMPLSPKWFGSFRLIYSEP